MHFALIFKNTLYSEFQESDEIYVSIFLNFTGFSKNFLNIGSDNIGNTIYLVSATKEFVCDLHQDGCTRDQITCYTR